MKQFGGIAQCGSYCPLLFLPSACSLYIYYFLYAVKFGILFSDFLHFDGKLLEILPNSDSYNLSFKMSESQTFQEFEYTCTVYICEFHGY